MGGVDDPTCAACPVAQALREQRDDLLAEIARLRGLGNLPGPSAPPTPTATDTPMPDPADLPHLCPECGTAYVSRVAAEYCCRERYDDE